MAVVSVWRGWWRGHLSIFCIQIVVGALLDRGYQISDGGETFQMINSGTDPWWWWQPPPVLTLAYCNVITIKHWPPPPPVLGDQTALTWEGAGESGDFNWSELDEEFCWWQSSDISVFVLSDRDFGKFQGIATQRLTVTENSRQTSLLRPSMEWWVAERRGVEPAEYV